MASPHTPIAEAALRDGLPARLRERVRLAKSGEVHRRPVIYWMRNALRAHENPALDAAAVAAATLRVPLLVLIHVEDLYPHATARRQLFLLQGARSVQAELHARGARAVYVQVDRQGHRQRLCSMLALKASILVAEEPFCVPWLAGVELLCEETFEAPVWLVDCSSVVPSALVPRSACQRAYAFEQATRELHAERVVMRWNDVELDHDEASYDYVEGLLPSVDLHRMDLWTLVQQMDVDMSVPPVSHTTGGSDAGYDRWARWVSAGGLKSYAKRRNDSLDVHGVSRMSAYLNAGMVSPFRLARDACSATGAGKSKFLHEFLTWRGLAYAHCYHFPMAASGATLAQLPAWAQETLRQHASDLRRTVSREQLALGRSGDAAWDGMQRYLVETGELHNNARMGWGKAVVKWTASPEEAIDVLLELNNRFALDGHAPPSYGGLLGCMGLFEGPKQNGRIFGRVAFKPPKARYAAMPALIKKLSAIAQGSRSGGARTVFENDHVDKSRTAMGGGARIVFESAQADNSKTAANQDCGGAGAAWSFSSEGAVSRKRRWVAKLRCGGTQSIDLT